MSSLPMTGRGHPPDPTGWDVSSNLHPFQDTPVGSEEGASVSPSSSCCLRGAADAAGGHGWSQCWCCADMGPCFPPRRRAFSSPLPPAVPVRRAPFRKRDGSAQPSARAVERWNQSCPSLGCKDRFLFQLIIQGSPRGGKMTSYLTLFPSLPCLLLPSFSSFFYIWNFMQ